MGINYSTKTGSDVASYVRRQFGDEAGVQINYSDILRWINQGQLEIAGSGTLKSKATTPSIADQNSYSFGTNRIISILAVWYDNVPLKSISFEQAQKTFDGLADSGVPQYWYEFDDSLFLYPVPQEAGKTITLYHARGPVDLVDITDQLGIPDSHYSALISFVMKQAYELDEDYTASQIKSGEFEQNLGKLHSVATDDVYPTITILEEDR